MQESSFGFYYVSKLKLMTFWNFLKRLTFLPIPARGQGVFRTQSNIYYGAFPRKIYFAKFTRKHLCRSLSLIKLQVSILQLHWKKGLQHRSFLMNFARYLRHLFYRTPLDESFCSTEKYFTNKIVKNPLRKEKKVETACKKNNDTHKTKT